MTYAPAPYYSDVALGAEPDLCCLLTARDGTRIRVAKWDIIEAQGTVLIFQGRTEYIEKYSDTAHQMGKRGFASVAIDWRGQGLSDRIDAERRMGHVGHFSEYQQDVDALMAFAAEQNMPKPYYLLGHSMGGCIGLETLHRYDTINAAAFSAPMWGLNLKSGVRAVAWGMSSIATSLGFGARFAPTSSASAEPAGQPFKGNLLTTDPEFHAWMQRQVKTHPDLFLAGPSLSWLNAALCEMLRLSRLAAPKTPALTWLGTSERIVEQDAIHIRMASWENGTLRTIEGAEHEVLVEKPQTRELVHSSIAEFFKAHP